MDEDGSPSPAVHARFAGPYALAAMPARYALERGDWKQAMTLEPRPSAVSLHGRHHALRARARRRAQRRRRGAEKERRGARAAARRPEDGEEQVLGDRGRGPAARRRRAGSRYAQGKRRGARPHARGRRPRRQEREAHRHAGPHRCPRASCSARCCSSSKRPADALKEFEASQTREPNRFRGFYGAALAAARASGDARRPSGTSPLVKLAAQGRPAAGARRGPRVPRPRTLEESASAGRPIA